ncbi:hypothetical protein P280DRAFT_108366 [Massarina eburnea CBS 473.64]|uniref:Protein kinase domain-containing protein n=1 Tax=Massarina eburnea CBS 473.64 TaxID=1395130 RepID=A0A6A6RT31_9PLEO|nr:hypothetical protein P280DRAFT_108366 [Massarina eburnea CBS 473.64]
MFPHENNDEASSNRTEILLDCAQPWVMGFESSRPEVDFSAGIADFCPERNVYRHLERQGEPSKLFNKAYETYALGVVLLEIGLWQSSVTLDKEGFRRVKNPKVVQRYLMRQAEKNVSPRMGEKYRMVVLRCLRNDLGVVSGVRTDLKLQQAFRSQVVDVLGRAADYVWRPRRHWSCFAIFIS